MVFPRFSHDESGILGKWRSYSDAQTLSYEKLPDGGILARVGGFEDLSSFRPYWIQLDPPDCLESKVLPMFRTELKKAQRVSVLQLISLLVFMQS